MKKSLLSICLTTLVFVAPTAVFADTTATSLTVSSQIQSLLTQIQNLQTQIKALQALQTQVQTAKTNITSSLQLIRNLREGMSGDDVTALQTALAADPSIYPQGTISGYFGKQTADALKRFQKKYNLEQVGYAGPKTLQKLNQLLSDLGLLNGGNQLCVTPGHQIAKGWLRKNNLGSAVSLCNSSGQVIATVSNLATSTPVLTNTTSPSVAVGGLISDTVNLTHGNNPTGTITFQVFDPTDTSCVTPLYPAFPLVTVNGNGSYSSANFTTSSVGTYRFTVQYSGDLNNYAEGTTCGSAGSTVAVTALDTTAPVTTSLLVTPVATTTTVYWTTNEPATSAVWFGTTNPLVLDPTMLVNSTTLSNSHSLTLSGLATSTQYFYEIVSADASGNTATSTQSTFTTTSGL